MSKLTDAQAALELKKKSFDKNIEALKKLDESCKKIATQGTEAESKAKSAKGDEKKKWEAEYNKIRQQHTAEDQKRVNLRKAQEELEKTIHKLEEQVNAGLAGVAKFGESRREYVTWFAGQRGALAGLAAEALKYQRAAEEAAKLTRQAADGGQIVKAAEAAGTCGKMAEFAAGVMGKFETLVRGYADRMSTQRNLAPTEFGVETADVQVHERTTTQVYETFRVVDTTRHRVAEAIEKATAAAKEADIFLATGRESEKRYALILDEADKAVAAKAKDYDDELGKTWGKVIVDEGKRFKDEAALIVKGKAETVSRGLKVAEQARAAVPKVMALLNEIVRQANEVVTKERGRVPEPFQRGLKGRVDKLSMALLGLLQTHKTITDKYPVSIAALEELEQKAKAAAG